MLSFNPLKLFTVGLLLTLSISTHAGIYRYKVDQNVSYGPYWTQTFDVYAQRYAKNAPIIVMIHGGAWTTGDKQLQPVISDKVKYWVGRKNFVVVSINYQTLPSADPLSQAEDAGRAIAQIQKLAPKWGGDPEKTILMGHSSGGHIAAVLGSSPSFIRNSGAPYPLIGTITLDGVVFDVEAIMNSSEVIFYQYIFKDPSEWYEVSPLHLLSADTPPFLLVCSGIKLSGCQVEAEFQEKADRLGIDTLIMPVNKTHRKINDDLGKLNEYTLDVSDLIDEILQIAKGRTRWWQ